jgi:hypothetical protein
MKTPDKHTRGTGWATVAFLLGIGVSVAANVAHTWHPSAAVLAAAGITADQWRPEIGAQAMAAFYPLALFLTIEILARVPWPRSFGWDAARYGGAALVAGVAAVVSYRHMAGLLTAYGEDALTAKTGPLSVDGLMVVSSFALLAIGRTRTAEVHPASQVSPEVMPAAADPRPAVEAPETAPEPVAERLPVHPSGNGQVRQAEPVPAAPASPAAPAVPAEPAEPVVADPLHLEAARVFAEEITAGTVPGIRTIKTTLKVGQPKACQVRTYLAALTSN